MAIKSVCDYCGTELPRPVPEFLKLRPPRGWRNAFFPWRWFSCHMDIHSCLPCLVKLLGEVLAALQKAEEVH